MNPLLRLLGAAASHGLLTAQIVFSAAFVGACELPAGSTVMVCPIGCSVSSTGQGVLVGIYGPVAAPEKRPGAEQRAHRQREQLMVLARRLAVVMQ